MESNLSVLPFMNHAFNVKSKSSLFCSYISKISLIFLYNFMYLFVTVLGLCCCTGFSLLAVSGGCYLVAVCRLLIAMASLVVEHRL